MSHAAAVFVGRGAELQDWFAAGDCDRRAGNVAGEWIGQHHIGGREFDRLARTFHGDLLAEVLHPAAAGGQVTLSAYGIERPSQFGVRTEDEVRIRVDFSARRATSTTARAL